MKGLISLTHCCRHLRGKDPWSLPGALAAISDKKQSFLCSDNDEDGRLGESGYGTAMELGFQHTSILGSQQSSRESFTDSIYCGN